MEREESHVKVKAEIRKTQLQRSIANNHQMPGEKHGTDPSSEPPDETSSVDTLILVSQPREL